MRAPMSLMTSLSFPLPARSAGLASLRAGRAGRFRSGWARTSAPGSQLGPHDTKNRAAGVARRSTQLLLDPEQLVVLGHPVGAGQRAGLDLARAGGHGEVGDGD